VKPVSVRMKPSIYIPTAAFGIYLPQRFQVFNKDTPFQAGLYLLPFSLAIPIGLYLRTSFAAMTKKPAILFILARPLTELLGASLFVTIPTSKHVLTAVYA